MAEAPRRDRDLVRLYWPVELRLAFDALFDVDEAMGAVVIGASQPALAAIKLAWWRERLEELDDGKVPAEPRLAAAARELLPRGVSGAQLAALETGWATLLQQAPDAGAVLARGARLFAMAAQLLGVPSRDCLSIAGGLHVAGQLTRQHLAPAGLGIVNRSARIPRSLRPLTGLAALAKRDIRRGSDIEPEATPSRAWTLLRHRLTGRI